MTPDPTASKAAPWRRLPFANMRQSTALFALAALLVTAIAAVTTGTLWHFRARALEDAERETRNLNLVLAEQTARAVQHVDFLLRMTVNHVQIRPDTAGTEHRTREMRELIAGTPQIRSMLIARADGQVTDSTSTADLPFSIADRPHFIALRDNPPPGPVISAPLIARTDGLPAISVSRRLETPTGDFDGIVATALDPSYFRDIYQSLALRDGSVIALFRNDGVRLLSYSRSARPDSDAASESDPQPELATMPDGLSYVRDGTGGERRIMSSRHVGDQPLVSTVSVAVDTVLAEWRGEARLFALGAFGASIILCVLFFHLAKEARRREALAEALRANEERFRNFAEASSDWFWEQDSELRFTYFSPTAYREPGRTTEDYLGKTRQELVLGGVTSEQWRQHQAALDARRAFRDFRYQRRDLDGSVRHLSISGKPVFDATGRFRGYAGNARDITHEIMTERRLLEAKAAAEAASRAKGEFLAVMSHELRTPLNAIIGFSDVLGREIFGPIGNAKYREYAGDILTAGRHLLGLISSILDMSKIEARKMELSEEIVDLATLIESCRTIIESQAAEAEIVLVVDLSEKLPRLRGDTMRIKQILLNLLSNAVKFTPRYGTVTLSAARDEAGALVLTVADTGIGMTAEETELALQPFRQVESALARRHEGTGLGLPLVKAFVEMHGGTLELDSERGRGTIARIVMPAERVVADEIMTKARKPHLERAL
jgi:PAS domain S-box-containing protein